MTGRIAAALQARADAIAAHTATADPPPAGADLAWQQDLTRGLYEDAAHTADEETR